MVRNVIFIRVLIVASAKGNVNEHIVKRRGGEGVQNATPTPLRKGFYHYISRCTN